MSVKTKASPESIIRDIKRKTRRKFTAEEKIRIVLAGLRGRKISATGREIWHKGTSIEDEIEIEIETTIDAIESNLVNLVEKFSMPLFELFDYFEIERKVLEDIVNNFVAGKVT